MKELKRTTEDGLPRPHYHVVYTDTEAQAGMVAPADNHVHELVYQPPTPEQPEQPAQTDPATGQEISPAVPAKPAMTGGWVVQPDPNDGHTHSIIEYPVKNPQKEPDDSKAVSDVITLFKTAREHEATSLLAAEESYQFYMGEQWSSAQRSHLDEQKRACLTLNYTGKYVDDLVGYQRQQRSDFQFLPMEGGDQKVADLLNIVAKQITERCYFEREESKAFEDAVIGGRGNLIPRISFDEDIRGDIIIERLDPINIVYGPHEKEDLSDCEYLVKHKMYSYAKFEQLWPDIAPDISRTFDMLAGIESLNQPHTTYAGDQYAQSDNRPLPLVTAGTDVLIDVAKKEIRILECWRRIYIPVNVVVNQQFNFVQAVYGWSSKDLKALKGLPGFSIISRTMCKFRVTKIACNTVLADEYPAELPIDDFMVVPIYAKKRGCKFWGKVEHAKDPQREINKRRSQLMDIGNKMVNYGWFYDSTTFPEGQREKFKSQVNSPGFVQEVVDVGRIPVKSEGTKFPAEMVQLMQLDQEHLAQLMSVGIEEAGANESGAAMMQRERKKLTGNEYLFDNLLFAKKRLGRLLISLIQEFYDPERIYRIVKNSHSKEPIKVGDSFFDQFTETDIIDLLQTTDLSKYDVIVSETSYSPTIKLANYLMLKEMASQGSEIPPEILIEASPTIPEAQKTKILESLAQSAQTQQQATSAAGDAELEKTLVAQGIIPPAVKERMGLETPAATQQLPEQQPAPPQNGFMPNDQEVLTG